MQLPRWVWKEVVSLIRHKQWPLIGLVLSAKTTGTNQLVLRRSNFCWVPGKLRQCGPTNRIVDDSDFKPSKFDCRLWSDLDSNEKIVSSIAITFYFDLLSIKINHFWYIFYVLIENRSKMIILKIEIFDSNIVKLNLYQKVDLFWLFWSLSIYFDLFRSILIFSI